jgi:hypothetical protein
VLAAHGLAAVSGLAAGAAQAAASADAGIRLLPLPTRVFKTPDAGHERTESWVFWVFVETRSAMPTTVESLRVDLSRAGAPIRSSTYDQAGVRGLTITPPLKPRLVDGSPSPVPIFWPQAVRIRCTEPAASGVDSMTVELGLSQAGRPTRARVTIPIETYVQKTSLIYPFRGQAVVTQAGVTNGGHRNRSGGFALDVVGLDENYSVYRPGGGKGSAGFCGWGREILAPADGVVARARADRPDQPDPDVSDPKYYAPEYPDGGDPGNHVILDHGAGEFSMLAHMQAGSVRVRVGDRVRQGQVLGLLGSSGDTETPHLHYQLQSGPDWEWADGLPCRFANVQGGPLARGSFFEAG